MSASSSGPPPIVPIKHILNLSGVPLPTLVRFTRGAPNYRVSVEIPVPTQGNSNPFAGMSGQDIANSLFSRLINNANLEQLPNTLKPHIDITRIRYYNFTIVGGTRKVIQYEMYELFDLPHELTIQGCHNAKVFIECIRAVQAIFLSIRSKLITDQDSSIICQLIAKEIAPKNVTPSSYFPAKRWPIKLLNKPERNHNAAQSGYWLTFPSPLNDSWAGRVAHFSPDVLK